MTSSMHRSIALAFCALIIVAGYSKNLSAQNPVAADFRHLRAPDDPEAVARIFNALARYAVDAPNKSDQDRRVAEALGSVPNSRQIAQRLVDNFLSVPLSVRQSAFGAFADPTTIPTSRMRRDRARSGIAAMGPRGAGSILGQAMATTVRSNSSNAPLTIRFKGFKCFGETGDIREGGSDEVYVIADISTKDVFRAVKLPEGEDAVFEDIDAGEVQNGPVTALITTPPQPVRMVVTLMNQNFSKPSDVKKGIDLIVKTAESAPQAYVVIAAKIIGAIASWAFPMDRVIGVVVLDMDAGRLTELSAMPPGEYAGIHRHFDTYHTDGDASYAVYYDIVREGSEPAVTGWSETAATPNAAAAGMTHLAEAHRNPDELNVFYQGPDRAIATTWSNRAVGGGAWQNPFPLTPPGAAKVETPLAAVSRGNQLHVFFMGPDNALASTWTDGGPWAAPFPITPPGAARGDSPLAAVVRGDQLHVFYIGPDGALASTWAAPNVDAGRWQSPFPITPPGASGARSRLDVVLRGSMLNVFYQGADGAFGTAWSMPEVDGGRWQLPFPITPPGAGIAGSAIDGLRRGEELHVFFQGPDGALASTWSAPNVDGGRWHDAFPITPPGAGRRGSPLVALLRGNDFDVHYIGPDGAVATVWAKPSVANHRWQSPYPITPPGFARGNSTLAATSRNPQSMDVFYLGQLGEIKALVNQPARQ